MYLPWDQVQDVRSGDGDGDRDDSGGRAERGDRGAANAERRTVTS